MTKFFIFSDESGSWHDINDVYVRSWIVITDEETNRLVVKIDEIAHFLNTNELTWKTLAGNDRYFDYFNDLSFRIFLTLSSPKDIAWESKYILTREFEKNISNLNYGKLEGEIISYIKERILRDVKNALFLNFYERHHMDNAKKAIERVILPTEYELIYRVDPPQMSKEGWENVLKAICSENINLEFPKSSKSQGVQFADIVAGCFRSFLLKDDNNEKATKFMRMIRRKLISKNKENPNPNLIFFKEINEDLKARSAEIWK